jgi:hypothetical protein
MRRGFLGCAGAVSRDTPGELSIHVDDLLLVAVHDQCRD